MTCRMEWTDVHGISHRCEGTTQHDGSHECDCGAIFTFGAA